MESSFLRDAIKNKSVQFSADLVKKFTTNYKVGQYDNNINPNPSIIIPSITQLESMASGRQ